MFNLNHWEMQFKQHLLRTDLGNDPAHDMAHFQRVVATAKFLASQEEANLEIIVPAAWLHDLVNLPKNSPERHLASRYSADAAIEFLKSIHYPSQFHNAIHHAICAHSYSAQIKPETKEAEVVQDADRLDGLGAIGIARCFTVGGALQRAIYDFHDPFSENRSLNDAQFTVDHFYAKLFKTGKTLITPAGKQEGLKRMERMKLFLEHLRLEIMTKVDS